MVDLAKIRKKAKKAAQESAATGNAGQGPESSPDVPEPIAPRRAQASRKSAQPAGTPSPVESQLEDPAAGSPEPAESGGRLERFKAEAGIRRGAAAAPGSVASSQAGEPDAHRLELLTFVVAGEQYAVDIERIVEIVTPRPLTRIPNAESSILGIISLRGTIVTMVDVRQRLRHSEAVAQGVDVRIVVVDFGSETVGFLVDRVLRVVKIEASEVEPHPVVHSNELEESIRGVFRSSGALTILLDLDKLLRSKGGSRAARTA